MLLLYALVALLLYLLPLVLYVTVAGRVAPRPPLARVLDLGIAVALDTFFVLLLAKFTRLGTAVWISRGLYVVLSSVAVLRFRVWPRARWSTVLAMGAVAALAMLSIWRCSYELIIWDRDWHVPLTSSLRASRLPFENVYLPFAVLRYHYLGNVTAAALQVLSLDRINSALALTLSHDLFLALTAGVVAYICWQTGLRRLWLLPLTALPLVFAGPLVLGKPSWREMFTTLDSASLCGFTYLNYTTLAYRPHVVVAGLYIVLVFAAVLVRLRSDALHAAVARTTASLLTSAAALALLDEASILMLTLGLWLAYQFSPRMVHPVPGRGIYLIFAMLLVVVVVNRLFDGSLSPGGPAQSIAVVPARHLSLFMPPVPFTEGKTALWFFLMDYFPYYTVVILSGLLALRTGRRDLAAVWVFFTSLVVVSCVFAFKIEVNHDPTEGHRFITAIMVLAPVTALYALCSVQQDHALLRGSLLVVLVCVTASGMLWERSFLRERFHRPPPRERAWAGPIHPMTVDCKQWGGAPRNDAPLEYVEYSVFYPYSGCQPGRFAARRSQWNLTTLGAVFGREAYEIYRSTGTADRLAAVVCARTMFTFDPACQWARQRLRCHPLPGGTLVRCPLDATTRLQFLEVLSRD